MCLCLIIIHSSTRLNLHYGIQTFVWHTIRNITKSVRMNVNRKPEDLFEYNLPYTSTLPVDRNARHCRGGNCPQSQAFWLVDIKIQTSHWLTQTMLIGSHISHPGYCHWLALKKPQIWLAPESILIGYCVNGNQSFNTTRLRASYKG